jgi:DNA modification methylase
MRELIERQQNLPFPDFSLPHAEKLRPNSLANKIEQEDFAFHDWYRFVLSFPPHLVRHYIEDFGLNKAKTVLDPFCGTGTTLVEAKLMGIPSIGIEANPFAHFAASVKTDWEIEPDQFLTQAREIAESALEQLKNQGIDDDLLWMGDIDAGMLKKLPLENEKLLLKDSISPLPLHKVLVLLGYIKKYKDNRFYKYFLLALAKVLVFHISNLKFGPEVGVGKKKTDHPVIKPWLNQVKTIAHDLRSLNNKIFPASISCLADSRELQNILKPHSVDAVITSPPYPNEKDYTRLTRLESVVLGFIQNREKLRQFKRNLIRSNTRGVYKGDDDDKWIEENEKILEIANQIEQKRIKMGKTSGFERLYPAVTRLYFGGMTRHLAQLRTVLKPGAKLAYVVGDQASYLRVMIRTGKLLAEIAEDLGYKVDRIDLFRTRFSTTTGEYIREEVVVLHWHGKE